MAENRFPNIVSGSTTGATAAQMINSSGSDVTIAIKRVSAIANVNAEMNYYVVGTIVYAENESAYYRWNGTTWVAYQNIPTTAFVSGSILAHTSLTGSSVHGLGTMSVQSASSVAITGGTMTGSFVGGINVTSVGIKDSSATTAIKFADASNVSLNTDNKTLIGSINETYDALSYLSAGAYDNIFQLIDNNNGTATISSGSVLLYSDSSFTSTIRKYYVSGSTFTFTDNTEEYIVVEYNSGSPKLSKITSASVINHSSVILLFNCWRQGNTIHSFNTDSLGNGLSNKIQDSLYNTEIYKLSIDGGLIISESTNPNPRTIVVTGGKVYTGAISQIVGNFNSSTDKMTFAYHVNGSWNYADNLVYNNSQYDNGTDLVSISANKWGVFWFYRSIGDAKQLFYVAGDTQYNKQSDAELSIPRGDLNILLKKHCMLVGRAIILTGATSGATESAFNLSFSGTAVINHNDTNNIQGGITDQYYHLTSSEYGIVQNFSSGSINGISRPIITKTGSYIANTSDYTILGDCTSGSIVIYLPASNTVFGHILNIKKIDDSPNILMLDGNGSESIDGDLTKTISSRWNSITIQSNGTSWYVL